jgi:transposase
MSKREECPISPEIVCKNCGGTQIRKNGFVRGHQRYWCKACSYNFTQTPARGHPLSDKVLAVTLYLSGLSMRQTAKLLGVSAPTIQDWIEQMAAAFAAKPEPTGRAVVIECDEMWHFLKKRLPNSGSGRLMIVTPVNSLTGNVAVVTEPPCNASSIACRPGTLA